MSHLFLNEWQLAFWCLGAAKHCPAEGPRGSLEIKCKLILGKSRGLRIMESA